MIARQTEPGPYSLPQPWEGLRLGELRRSFPYHKVYVHRPGVPTLSRRALGVRLSFVAALALGGISVAFLSLGAQQRLESAEKSLQTVVFSPKLNPTSAERPVYKVPVPPTEPEPATSEPPVSPPPPVEPARELPQEHQPPLLQAPPEPAVTAPPTVQHPPELPVVAEPPKLAPMEPVDSLGLEWEPILAYTSTLEPHRGESPMLRNWKMIELAAVLAVAVTPVSALLAGEEKDKKPSDAVLKRLDAMDKTIAAAFETIGKDIADLKKDVLGIKGDHLQQLNENDKLNVKLGKLQTDLDNLRKRFPAEPISPIDRAGLEEVKTRLAQIERTLESMRTSKRVALSPPATGRIVLVNQYPEDVLFMVNGRPYRLVPNSSARLEGVAAGAFTYELISDRFGLRAQKTLTLSPNETIQLTAR
jgi:hypothetical protein